MLLWYSRSGGIFCRVQSNALLICALFKYNILIDALIKVRHATEDHWSALGTKNHLETWSRFLSPNLTNLSPGCQLAYFFFFSPAAPWSFSRVQSLLEKSGSVTFLILCSQERVP